MSPEFSIEPGRLVGAQRLSQLLSDTVLAQSTDSEGDGAAHGRAELIRQTLQFLMCLAVDPHTSRLHAYQHTGRRSCKDWPHVFERHNRRGKPRRHESTAPRADQDRARAPRAQSVPKRSGTTRLQVARPGTNGQGKGYTNCLTSPLASTDNAEVGGSIPPSPTTKVLVRAVSGERRF